MALDKGARLLARVRDTLCVLCLIAFILSEAYSAAAIALDQFAPSWERTVGWFLLILPTALTLGLVLLLYANLRRTGFYLATSSLFLYAVLICAEAYRGPAERGDWIFGGFWLAFCAIGILAAKLLMSRSTPSSGAFGTSKILT